MKKNIWFLLMLFCELLLLTNNTKAQREMEGLTRGIVAMNQGKGNPEYRLAKCGLQSAALYRLLFRCRYETAAKTKHIFNATFDSFEK